MGFGTRLCDDSDDALPRRNYRTRMTRCHAALAAGRTRLAPPKWTRARTRLIGGTRLRAAPPRAMGE